MNEELKNLVQELKKQLAELEQRLPDEPPEFAKDHPDLRMAIENPIGIMSNINRKPHQIIQPWMFGDYESKATCLWLKNLPQLIPTYKTPEKCREALRLPEGTKLGTKIHKMPPGPNRAKERSRTFPGIAATFADQWGNLC